MSRQCQNVRLEGSSKLFSYYVQHDGRGRTSLIAIERRIELPLYFLSEWRRFDHKHVWPVPQNIHNEFTRITVRNLEL